MGGCLFFLAILCFIIGFIQFFAPDPRPALSGSRAATLSQPKPVAWQQPRQVLSQPAPATTGGKTMQQFPQKLDWVKLNQRIYARHPVKGELMAHVLGRIQYSELWQRSRGPQSPWVPTGNVFLGFWLEGGLFLLNWQNRIYLFDESTQLSDADIQRDFAPHARKFAQSDQTADIYFAYPPAMWHIDDIGKFRVDATEGEGLIFNPGATGRFIHASGDSGRALAVEDYEGGGGGQDMVWIGYQLKEEDVRPEG